MRTGTVTEKHHLLLDFILQFAPQAVALIDLRGRIRQVRHHKTGVGSFVGMFGLVDNPALARPTARSVLKLAKVFLLFPAAFKRAAGLPLQLSAEALQAFVAGDADDVIDPIALAPAKHPMTAKASIAPVHDLCVRPALSDVAGQ